MSRECCALENGNTFRRNCTRTLIDVIFVTERKGDSLQSDKKGYGVVGHAKIAPGGDHFYDPAVRWKRGKVPFFLCFILYIPASSNLRTVRGHIYTPAQI
jgi:hypothetical protein